MNPRPLLQIWLRWLIAVAAFIALAACASGPGVVDHSFGFDLRQDNQDAVVLDYRYGDSKLPVRAPQWAIRERKTFSFESVTGPMLRGDFLYVKWRIKSTGMVYEDTVDLRNRLPADIKDHRVTFIIRGPQLYVYLIPPEGRKRAKGKPPNGPRMYEDLDTVTIYPDQPKP